MKAFCAKMGDEKSDEDVAEVMAEYDLNKDGTLSFDKFCKVVMLEEVSALIKEGWDVNQQNTRGKTPLDIAQSEEVKALLREHGGKHSLFHVVESCMLEEVSALIRAGADVNQQNAEGETPLDIAVTEEERALLNPHLV